MTDATPLKITPQIKELITGAIDSGNVLLLAAVDKDGKPILSYRGSTSVYDDTTLSLWARNPEGSSTIKAIKQNPNVAMMYRAHPDVPFIQFTGRARITEDEGERERVFSLAHEKEQGADPERTGAAIIIELDSISGVPGFDDNGPVFLNMARA